ncbi:hypothetical protein KCU96_g29, partial [Aureobasidium melanogenum]
MNYLVELAAALRRLLKPRADRLCPIWKRKSNRKKVVGAGVLGWKKTASRQQSIGSEQTKRCKLDPNTFEIKLKSMKKLSARLMATRTRTELLPRSTHSPPRGMHVMPVQVVPVVLGVYPSSSSEPSVPGYGGLDLPTY